MIATIFVCAFLAVMGNGATALILGAWSWAYFGAWFLGLWVLLLVLKFARQGGIER